MKDDLLPQLGGMREGELARLVERVTRTMPKASVQTQLNAVMKLTKGAANPKLVIEALEAVRGGACGMSLPAPRSYQSNVLDLARAKYAEGAESVLIVSPTGTGKTRTAVEACFLHAQLGGVPMFVAPRRELLNQAASALEARGLAVIRDGQSPLFKGCHVKSIQELSMPGAHIPLGVTLGVLDEARHYVADRWSCIRTRLPDALFLGLDATPERADGRGLRGMYDTLLEAISIKDAIDGGYLVPCDVIRPDRALDSKDLAQNPVDMYVKHAPGESAVLFAASVDIAQKYAREFDARGIPALAVWGDMGDADRDEALRRYELGEVKVLCNVQILTEGWDSPRTSCVILTSAITTAGGMLQRIGRGLRPFPGKERCIILDCQGVTHTFGEPDEERTWHLDGLATTRAGALSNVRFCPVCGGIVTTDTCDGCGHNGEMRKRKPRVLGLPMDRFARQHQMSDEEAAPKLAGYIHAARQQGRSTWWAYKAFEGKYGRPVTAKLKQLARKAG